MSPDLITINLSIILGKKARELIAICSMFSEIKTRPLFPLISFTINTVSMLEPDLVALITLSESPTRAPW